MLDDRSLGEAHRRLDDHDKRIGDMVPQKVYDADQKAVDARQGRTEKDVGQLYERVRTFIWVLLGAIAAGVAADVIRTVRGDG